MSDLSSAFADPLRVLIALFESEDVPIDGVASLNPEADALLDHLRVALGERAATVRFVPHGVAADTGARTVRVAAAVDGGASWGAAAAGGPRDGQRTTTFLIAPRLAGSGGAAAALLAFAEQGWTPEGGDIARGESCLAVYRLAFRNARIRLAGAADLPALERLERVCWAPGLQASLHGIERRLEGFPEGQHVLEHAGVVVGAVYSQRVAAARFEGVTASDVHVLHRPDGPIAQLLALNIAPEVQDRGFGDRLLDFALERYAATPGVDQVVGITRCKDAGRHPDLSPADYVALRNEQGRYADPVLRMHELHGAEIVGLVEGYRPTDATNRGTGVLVRYDLKSRRRNEVETARPAAGVHRPADVLGFVRGAVAVILDRSDRDDVPATTPLFELGLDSADLLDLNERLRVAFGIALEPAFFFEHNTCARIAAFLDRGASGKAVPAAAAPSERRTARPEDMAPEDMAIVGAACLVPGEATSPRAFWRLLIEGRQAVGPLPKGRWAWPEGFDLSAHPGVDQGGFLADVARFDAAFFRISPREATSMDPQQRLLLQTSWACFEDAGWRPSDLAGSDTGVFVGASGSDYHLRLCELPQSGIEGHFALGASMAVLANRLSYVFDFDGPSLQIDTACSSSLVALHEAVAALRAGACGRALVAGVNILCHPANSIAFHRAGMLSKDGRCKTFDAAADGYVRGEGVVALLLKPLAAALADGDHVRAVVKGTATNHGGQAAGLTVPNPAKQADLVRRALRVARVAAETITYVEAHGTGTALGDPIEVRGLKEAFGPGRTDPACRLGSVKTNIGHLEAAAGLAGVLKTLLALQAKTIPASLNFNRLNPHLSFEGSPFAVAVGAEPWTPAPGAPRRAGVSSFGSGGSNAHVILEEAPEPPPPGPVPGPMVVPLSAKTSEGLRGRAADLLEAIESDDALGLAEVAYTLQLGREAFDVRAVFVVETADGLRAALRALLAGETKPRIAVPEAAGKDRASKAAAALREGRRHDLARLWGEGAPVDWTALWDGAHPRRVALPTYPFAGERHWAPDGVRTAAIQPPAVREDLLARVRAHVAVVLDMPAAALAAEAALRSYGLDSIGGLRLQQRLEEDLGVVLTGLDILESANLASLTEHVAALVASRDLRPLSKGQLGIWALQATTPETSAYNLPFGLRVRGTLDTARLDRAIRAAVTRHPTLGERVVETPDGPRRAARAPIAALAREDARALGEEELSARLTTLARQPFRLEAAAALRAHLLDRDGEAVLLLVIHHLAFDAGSIEPFFTTMLDAYIGDADEAPAAESVSYDAFVAWQEQLLAGPEGEQALRHFANRLAGAPAILDLPADKPRQASPRVAGATATLASDDAAAERISRFCRAEGVTPASLFLTAFAVALGRHADVEDLVVGVTAAVRRRPEFAGIVGYFVNMVPVRLPIDEGASWANAIRAAQKAMVGDLDHAAFPFSVLVRNLRPDRTVERTPIFQAAFNYQNYFGEDAFRALEERYAERLPFRFLPELRQDGEYEVELEVTESRDGFVLRLKYDPDLFRPGTAERLVGHVMTLVVDGADRPAAPLRAVSMLTSAETRLILGAWVGDGTDLSDRTVHALVEAQAAQTPDAIAMICGEDRLTYADLGRRADRLAGRLLAAGVRPGDRVGVCLRRSLELPLALLAVLKAGAAYVPLEPDLPAGRLASMVEDAGLAVIVTGRGLPDRLERAVPPEVRWLAADEVAAEGGGVALPIVAPEALAYVIYTSGSTGAPKGVMISHRAFASALMALAATPGLAAGDRLFAVTTYGFDIAGFELFGPLIVGATCVLCPSGVAQDAERLKAVVEKARPTLLQATPTLWDMLFESGWRPPDGMRLLCGGEPLSDGLRRRFEACAGEVWNMYGPTEATIWATAQRVAAGEPQGVGRPLANTRIHILDKALRPTPVGVPGELCIAGCGLADGYLNRPELTEGRFIPNPFEPGGRLYRTGDRARWLPDGSVDLLGRADGQVKLWGHRIELGDIEANLVSHPAVREAVAVMERIDGHPRLAAHYLAANGLDATEADLRSHLKARLPHYMIPARIERRAVFPLTPNGKVDRAALAAQPVAAAAVAESVAATPDASALEARLSAIWRTALARPQLGRDEGFFDVGGDSVLAVSVARRISEATGTPFSVTELFRHPTIAAIAAFLAPAVPPVPPPAPATTTPASVPADAPEPVRRSGYAIVGVSGCFPGAETVDRFWDNLLAGRDAVLRPSAEELLAAGAPEAVVGDPRFVSAQATIGGKELFDAAFFRVAPRDAERMHPQMRLLLAHAWSAVEDAGYAARDIPDTAVYMTASNTAYGGRGASADRGPDVARVLPGFGPYQEWLLAQPGTIPTIVSHRLGLKGPSCFVHSNCSSSLVALDLACQALARGEARQALVGAASMLADWSSGYVHQDGLNFAADGKVKTFDATADGMIGGEGVAVVMIKRLEEALRDGDSVYAVIRGIAITNDGADKAGFYAPSVKGQAAAITRALAAAGVAAETISYVEAHGTGTSLGDPIELAALQEAFGGGGAPRPRSCGLGSVKSNIGHLDAAAGLAGLIKAALALKHGVVPPTLHFTTINPNIALDGSPFFIVDTPWRLPADGPALAAVSSFGIGGTNAHAVLERAPERPAAPGAPGGPELFVLSGKDRAALTRLVENLLVALDGIEAADLPDVAFTLQTGREAMDARLALVADGKDELADRLRRWLADDVAVEGVYGGRAGEAAATASPVFAADADFTATVALWLAHRRLPQLAALWAQGYPLRWEALARFRRPRRVRLPTYPFAAEAFWVRSAVAVPQAVASASARRHPLLHENVSTLWGQRFAVRFSGHEPVLADHRFQGVPVMPGVGHLEMARAAAAGSFEAGDTEIRLSGITWLRPLAIERDLSVLVEIEPADDGAIVWTIREAEEGGAADKPPFSRGRAQRLPPGDAPVLDLVGLRAACGAAVTAEASYRRFVDLGFTYGRAYRSLVELAPGRTQKGEPFVLAQVALPDTARAAGFILHPSVMDAMLQTRVGFDRALTGDGESLSPSMPFVLDELLVFAPTPERGVVWARPAGGGADGIDRLDIDLADPDGHVCVAIRGFASRPAAGHAAAADILVARPLWEETAPCAAAAPVASRGLVVLCGDGDRVRAVAGSLAETAPGLGRVVLGDLRDGLGPVYRAAAADLLIDLKALASEPGDTPILAQLAIFGEGEQALFEGLSALLATACLEHPRLVGQTIRFAGDLSAEDAVAALAEDAAAPRDLMIRRQAGARLVRRWAEAPDLAAGPPPWRAGGVYLITGGFGGLGLLFAEEIARSAPAATIILVGRSAPGAPTERRIAALEAGGAHIVRRTADVADAAALDALVAGTTAEHGRLTGVLHAAGVLRDGLMAHKSARDLETVLRPKVDGVVHLDAATAGEPLELFVLFASGSGALGNVGQTDYAAANAFLDSFAAHRNRLVAEGRRSGRTIAIDWPLWADGGMTVNAAAERSRRARGLVPLSAEAGLRVFTAAAASRDDQILVLCGDAPRLRADLFGVAEQISPPKAESGLRDTPPLSSGADPLRGDVAEALKRLLAPVIGLPASRIETETELDAYGIDSVMAIELVTALEAVFGPLSKTLLFERRSVGALADHFLARHRARVAELVGTPHPPAHEAPAPLAPSDARPAPDIRRAPRLSRGPAAKPARADIAIIGLAGRYPRARNVDAFWQNLRDGTDCITEIPRDRWDHSRYFDPDKSRRDKTYSKWGGFIDGVDECDPLFFGVSPREMEAIDPQERLFLQCAYEAIEDAGYSRQTLAPERGVSANVGVYVGVMYAEYQLFGAQAQSRGVPLTLTGSPASIANRVSYFFDFTGPSLAVDTMCSSSLTAIHLACRDLGEGCDYAIAGGVNVSVHPNKYLFLGQRGFVSSRGQCQSFGEGGDGYVPGEGVGAVLLKPLSRALSDGDRIYGVIRGTSVNHGGKTNGYTVPNPQAQGRVIERALRAAGVDAREVSYVEAHGTGTSLGDPIEIAGLTQAFERFTADRGFCAIGSAKSNIGHCESAAGIAGLTKVLLQMRHGELAPSLHAETLNPHIDFAATPFVVQRERAPWRRRRGADGRELPRIAGVSSFGAGGANAHVVIEEYASPEDERGSAAASGPQILVLSGRTEERLRARAADLAAALETEELAGASLADVAFTLQLGREALEARLALVAESAAAARDRLLRWLGGAAEVEGLWVGEGRREREGVLSLLAEEDLAGVTERWLARGQVSRLAEAWTKGVAVDWHRLHPGKRRRVKLPTYPFERGRYWIEDTDSVRPSRSSLAEALPRAPLASAPDHSGGRTTLPPAERARQAFRDVAADLVKLKPADLSPEADLVDHGFDSITLAQLANRLNEAYGLGLSASDFFESRTLGAVVARLEGVRHEALARAFGDVGSPAAEPAERPAAGPRVAPLSPAQRRLWLVEQIESLGAAYHVSSVLLLSGRIDAAALRRAFAALITRHAALRTRIASAGEEAVQAIDPPGEPPFAAEEVPGATAEERAAAAQARKRALIAEPFDLTNGPLLRCVLLRLDDEEGLLVLVIHHIVTDGWSMDLIGEELRELYAAEIEGRDARLAPLPIGYADIAVARRSQTGTEEDLAFWREALRGAPPESTLPADRNRPVRRSHRGEAIAFDLSPELTAGLRKLAQRSGASLFMVLVTGLQALIARLSGQEDVVVGTAVAGRRSSEQERIVGFFADTLALRADLSGEPSFENLLRRVRTAAEQAYAHQDVGFERLVEELNPERDLSRHPLFQVMMTLRRRPPTDRVAFGPHAVAEVADPEIRATPFDVALHFLEDAATVSGTVEFALDLYDRAAIEQAMGTYRTLLAAAAVAPATPVWTLPLLDDAGRDRFLAALRGPAKPLAALRPTHEQVAARAKTHPASTAILFDGRRLSYAELDARANRLAHHLVALGAGQDAIVGVCLERSEAVAIALLAVLKAGGGYLPLDPAYPERRLRTMLTDSGAGILVTQASLRDFLNPGAIPVVLMDEVGAVLADYPECDPQVAVGLDHLAYVIYTSGSTGGPKGVMISHRALANVLAAVAERVPLAAGDVMAAVTPLSFDIAGVEFWLPLIGGATVAVASRDTATSGEALRRFLRDVGAMVLQVTPATWRMLVEAGWTAGPGLTAVCGGEALTRDLALALTANGGVAWNLYGPTETTIWSTGLRLTADWRVGSIGWPIDNTQLFVLDRHGQLLPPGAPGELCIAGAGLARGYLGRKELTEERFPLNPFGPPGSSLYRTGDLVRARPDGEIVFLGRLDHQVKIRGYRIELGEIEAVLREDPAVRQAVVTVRELGPGDRRLAAYVVVDPGAGVVPPEGRDDPRLRAAAWRAVWDDTHEEAGEAFDPPCVDRTARFTGRASADAEMRIWRDEAAGRIAALRPKHLLEIGCGLGLLLERIAPSVDVYCGTDVSEAAIVRLVQWARKRRTLGHVRLACREAADYWEAEEGAFDVVVLNSVAQSFPDAAPLEAVLARAVAMAPDGGAIFVGGLRPFSLLPTLAQAVEIARSDANDAANSILDRARQGVAADTELAVDAGFFFALKESCPRISAVEAMLKTADSDNELTRYSYDVILRIGSEPGRTETVAEEWPADTSIEEILRELEAARPPALVVRGALNARLARDRAWAAALEAAVPGTTVADIRTAAPGGAGIDPAAAAVLAERCGYHFAAMWSADSSDGRIDLAFFDPERADVAALALGRPATLSAMSDYANTPRAARPEGDVEARLRDHLRAALPDHMVPADIVILPRFPLTPSGKIDRAALPVPQAVRSAHGRRAPTDPLETALVRIWSEVLGLAEVGVDDDFFRLGGHSLLVMRIVLRVREVLNLDLSMRDLFEAPTIAALSERLRTRPRWSGASHARDGGAFEEARSVRLRQGVGTPIFLLPAMGGGVRIYDQLVQALGGARTVYGLNGLRKDAASDIEGLAAEYAEEIRRLRPDGELRLVGWSFGGVLAYETACRLHLDGREVASLTLIDACLPKRSRGDGAVPTEDAVWAAFAHILDSEQAGTEMHGRRAPSLGDYAALAAGRTSLSADDCEYLYEVFQRNMRAWAAYRPRPVPLPLTVIRAGDEENAVSAERDFIDWGALTGGAESTTLVGDHVSLLRPPHVAAVAKLVDREPRVRRKAG